MESSAPKQKPPQYGPQPQPRTNEEREAEMAAQKLRAESGSDSDSGSDIHLYDEKTHAIFATTFKLAKEHTNTAACRIEQYIKNHPDGCDLSDGDIVEVLFHCISDHSKIGYTKDDIRASLKSGWEWLLEKGRVEMVGGWAALTVKPTRDPTSKHPGKTQRVRIGSRKFSSAKAA